MNEEFCPECGAKITGKTGFCSECGAVTTSLNNKIKENNEIIKERKEIQRIENIEKWYHKPDKNHKTAVLYSIFLPFSGNLYLRENIINLLLTILSILFILGNIIGLLTIDDFYYRHTYLLLYSILWWIVSIFTLCLIVLKYNRRKAYYKKDEEKYSKESSLPNLFTKAHIKYIPFILVILFLIVNIGVMFSDSPKTFDTADFSLHYPHEYTSDGVLAYNPNLDQYKGTIYGGMNKAIEIYKYPAYQYPITYYVDNELHPETDKGVLWNNTYKGKTNVDNTEAYIIQQRDSYWTEVIFIKDGQLYYLTFQGEAQKDMDTIINSFKFK